MRDILMIAELTIREARRRKIIWLGLGLGVALVALYALGFYFIHQDFTRSTRGSIERLALDAGFNFVVMAGLYGVSFLGVMLAVLVSVGALAGEISSQTIHSLAVKPMPRRAILLGKWLGLAALLSVYIALLAGGIVLATYFISSYLLPRAVLGILLIIMQALIMLSLSILGGSRLNTLANGVMAFMLYGLAFIGGWIEQVGVMVKNQAAEDIGILSSLIVPSEAMWKMAAYVMQPPVTRMLGTSPFSMGNPPSAVMLAYALGYIVIAILLAMRLFATRDL
jgi:Cu-processing system permease protein